MLRHAVHAWMERHGLPVPQAGIPEECLVAADPGLPGWVTALRSGDVLKRGIEASWAMPTAAVPVAACKQCVSR